VIARPHAFRGAQLAAPVAENTGVEALRLYRGESAVAEVPLGERPIEIGRAHGCDLVVGDPALAPRHVLVAMLGGAWVVYDLAQGRLGAAPATRLEIGGRIALGARHAIERVSRTPAATGSAARSPRPGAATPLALVVGHGREARRILLDERPLHVGQAPDNDVVVCDQAASARHCRLEPCAGGVQVRDLESARGTFANGVRVYAAVLGSGATLRVGRTDLALVDRDAGPGSEVGTLVAESPSMLDALAEVQRFARLPWPVLLVGESGTGKEGLARALHDHGPRRHRPFVPLNAGGLPRDLVESELFGHERGAFTGATATHRGVFEQADGGTLFLDEIGELPLELQARLLRALESGELRRVGGEGSVRVDVRLVCATHRDLRAMAAEERFRHDLYFRIARLAVEVPPLRARPEDVRALAAHFMREMAGDVGEREIGADAHARLASYPWPGNARELRNVLSVALAGSSGPRLDGCDVERALARVGALPSLRLGQPDILADAVAAYGGNLSAAARALGMARSTLRDRMRTAA
jgi:transcriptional regulator of acetoin/glycerol metabolism